MARFTVENVKCEGCAATLKKALLQEFGEVWVDLDVVPRAIELDIADEQIDALRAKLRSIGYPMSDERLGFVADAQAKATSFVSCAAGKFDIAKR